MKRKMTTLFLTLFTALCLFCLTTCVGVRVKASVLSAEEEKIVLRIEEASGDAMLINALDALEKEGKLSFEASNGMITSVNGKANQMEGASSGYSWMLYTSNTELSYAEYGSKTHGETVCYSAAFGAEQLAVKAGETIILSYDYWSF